MAKKIPTRKKRFKVICPDCGKEREISYATHRMIITDPEKPGRCMKCGIKYRDEKKKANFVANYVAPVMPWIRVCGCKVSKNVNKYDSGLAISVRCDRFHDCKYQERCLDAVAEKGWDGFTGDLKGFVAASEGDNEQRKNRN